MDIIPLYYGVTEINVPLVSFCATRQVSNVGI